MSTGKDATSHRRPVVILTFILIFIGLLVGFVVVVDDDGIHRAARYISRYPGRFFSPYYRNRYQNKQPPVCGNTNTNGNSIDLRESENPGPFHDLTVKELKALRTYLENDPNIRAVRTSRASINSSYIFMADLLVARKANVLSYLDGSGQQPLRQARVQMFRGDLNPPLVEEYICGPLPDIQECCLMNYPNRRNPVEFSVRPFNDLELAAIATYLSAEIDREIGYILQESFGAMFTGCTDPEDVCLFPLPVPVGSAIVGDINKRRMWLIGVYDVPYLTLHDVDFGVLANLDGSDPTKWTADRVWYAGRLYGSYEELRNGYDSGSIPTTSCNPPVYSEDLFSTLNRRGEPVPPRPQRHPTQVEPDGIRYSLKDRKVDYLGWNFNFRMSPITGPAIFDVRYRGERIAYEISLNEIAAFYAGLFPQAQSADYTDSGALIGVRSKSLVPGADCPEYATLINQTFWSESGDGEDIFVASFCMFEQNHGSPLRRHLSYTNGEGGFYGGMLDSALVLRSAMTITNYDYLVDFIFHQNGAFESAFLTSGALQATPFREEYAPTYGSRVQDKILGSIHLHLAHFKVDLDVSGTSNRYETLDIVKDRVPFSTYPNTRQYDQFRVEPSLKTTEKEALYKFNFDAPRHHVVHNNDVRNQYGDKKAYRIVMKGMVKSLLTEGSGNEPTIAWNRHQLVVTKHKDEEFISGANYGFFDSLNPTVDFTQFYEDDEDIVDEDLVFWITHGLYHLPHTEDLPVVSTVGNQLNFFLLPYNYYPECPSIRSRDSIYIDYKEYRVPTSGVRVNRYGNSRDQCIIPRVTLEEDVAENPTQVLADF